MDLNVVYRALGVPFSLSDNLQAMWPAVQALIIAVKAGTYHTPGSNPVNVWPIASTISMKAFDPANITAMTGAMQTYYAAFHAGDVAGVHAATDAVNLARRVMGYPDFVPPADVVILQNIMGPIGDVARAVAQAQSQTQETLPVLDPANVDLTLAKAMSASTPTGTPSLMFPQATASSTAGGGLPGSSYQLGAVVDGADGTKWMRVE